MTPVPAPMRSLPSLDAPVQATPADYKLQTGAPETEVGGPAIFACQVLPETAPILKTIKTGQDFDAMWLVQNVGNRTWSKQSVQYVYLRGKALQRGNSAFPLPQDAPPGETVRLVTRMQAPSQPGNYLAFWSLLEGPDIFCTLEIQLVVTP